MTDTTADRAAMRLELAILEVEVDPVMGGGCIGNYVDRKMIADALSAHGLFKELVTAARVVNNSRIRIDGKIVCPQFKALTALGDTASIPAKDMK